MCAVGYHVYTPSKGSISNLCHIETVNYNSILCKLFCISCKFCDLLYSTVYPMKHLESDVMWYKGSKST